MILLLSISDQIKKNSLTVQHVHVDGLGLRVGRITLVPAVVLNSSFLYEQMTGGNRSFLGNYVHTSSGRIVTDYLKAQNKNKNQIKWSSLFWTVNAIVLRHMSRRCILRCEQCEVITYISHRN